MERRGRAHVPGIGIGGIRGHRFIVARAGAHVRTHVGIGNCIRVRNHRRIAARVRAHVGTRALRMIALVLGLRGFAAIVVLTTLVGGIPRVAQAALAVTVGVWSAFMVAGAAAGSPIGIDVNAIAALDGALVVVAVRELVIGAALGVMAAVPLLAASAAGRLVDIAATGRAQGPYGLLFGVLAAAVFVGIDGHVVVLTAVVESHAATSTIGADQGEVVAVIARLVPAAIRLAVPWLVTAAVVQVALGVGTRVAARAGAHVTTTAATTAVPAAHVMMTASLVATLALAIAAVVRGTF